MRWMGSAARRLRTTGYFRFSCSLRLGELGAGADGREDGCGGGLTTTVGGADTGAAGRTCTVGTGAAGRGGGGV